MPKSRAQPGISNTNRVFVIVPKEKSLPALVAGLLPADQRCSRSASCRFAIDGTAPCDGSDFPACGRRRLQPPTPDAAVPTRGPSLGSSGSAHLAYGLRLHHYLHPPRSSTDGSPAHLSDKA